jgi:hypothetical protein
MSQRVGCHWKKNHIFQINGGTFLKFVKKEELWVECLSLLDEKE